MAKKIIKLGTRGSPLALVQANMVKSLTEKAVPDVEVQITIIKSNADWKPEHGEIALDANNGGKGQFASEIEAQLLNGTIDAGVHSMKDMDSFLPNGLHIPVMLEREDPRDALLLSPAIEKQNSANNSQNIFDYIPENSKVGTTSVRRKAFLLEKRPDLHIDIFRGNVETRLQKLSDGQVDATFLAVAGLNRLGLAEHISHPIPETEMLPACGQGAIGVEMQQNRGDILSIFSQINDTYTLYCVSAERAALQILDGSCHTPIGAHATLSEDALTLSLKLSSLNGKRSLSKQVTQACKSIEDAQDIGRKLAHELKESAPLEITESLK